MGTRDHVQLWETSRKKFGRVPKTLTLFMTKICDFPYPIYDLTLRSLGKGLLLLA